MQTCFGAGKILAAVLVGAVALGSGCASKIDTSFVMPTDTTLDNSRIYNAPYDKVWKAVVDSAGQSFFVMENIEKDSGIMSISFSTNETNKYANCGKVIDNGSVNGKQHHLEFDGSTPQMQRVLISPITGLPINMLRTTKIIGKANIIVNKISEKKTKVSVNTRYILTLTYSGTDYLYVNFTAIPRPIHESLELSFTGKEAGSFDASPSMTCKSTFKFEDDILKDVGMRVGE